MRCLVLGGGGFIGSHLSDALLSSNHEVGVFDRPTARHLDYVKNQGARIFLGDYLNPDDIGPALSNCDVLYHLLSTTVPQTSNDDPRLDIEANVIGTLRLLEEVRKAQVKKIVFASSGGTVYGIPQKIPIKENHSTEPISSYGISKLMIEKYLHLSWVLYGLDYCVLRIANAYGERQSISKTQGVISAFLGKAFSKEEIIIWGDGSVVRDYVYVGDIASAFLQASSYKGKLKIFNIGSGHGHSLTDIIQVIENTVGFPLQVKYMQGRPFDVPINVLDISLAKSHLNWEPKVQLGEGILYAFKWMQRDQGR